MAEPEYLCPERHLASVMITQAFLDARQIARRNAKHFRRDLTATQLKQGVGDRILLAHENDIEQFLLNERFDSFCYTLGLETAMVAAYIHSILVGEKLEEFELKVATIIDEAERGRYGNRVKCLRGRKSCLQLQLM